MSIRAPRTRAIALTSNHGSTTPAAAGRGTGPNPLGSCPAGEPPATRRASCAPALDASGDAPWWLPWACLAALASAAWLAGGHTLAVYALSFWHYYLYWLAYRYGAVSLQAFKRDAVLMKTVSLLALASAYLAAPLDPASLAVVAAGFLLNALGAAALGSDRTYYGREVADLPPLRVTRFPYSVISHPMLVGNMLAFGGTLLNAEFREQWWPLACAHGALNLGLLAMERWITPLRLGARRAVAADTGRPARSRSWSTALVLSAAAAALGLGAAALTGAPPAPLAATGAAVAACAHFLYRAYTASARPPGERRPAETETSQ